jgi:hypothetical protein
MMEMVIFYMLAGVYLNIVTLNHQDKGVEHQKEKTNTKKKQTNQE